MLSETGQDGTSVLYKETNRVGKGLSHTSLSDAFFMPHNKNPENAVKDCTKYKYELEYVLDIDDLEKLDYRITYPPSGAIEQLRIVYPE